MNKKLKRVCLLTILVAVNVISITGCDNRTLNTKTSNTEKSKQINVNEDNAKALSIDNTKISDLSKDEKHKLIKIKNVGTFNISKVVVSYQQLDKSKNFIADSKTFLDMTLSSGEVAYLGFEHKEYTETINITQYSYEVDGNLVSVSLDKDKIAIEKSNDELKDSVKYEVLTTSDIYKVNETENGDTYGIKVKNSSSTDLGNIILKIAELNENGEYIKVNPVVYNNILKSQEEAQIDIIPSQDSQKIVIVGYTYDDTEDKINIDIDLKSHIAKIK